MSYDPGTEIVYKNQQMVDKRNIKKWLEQFETDMAAASLAEAGEHEFAREILREKRNVLLAITDEKRDVGAFNYAVNICKRIGTGLHLLIPERIMEIVKNTLSPKLMQEGINHKLIKISQCIREEILEYTRKNRDILFVVVESVDGLDLNCREPQQKIPETWKNLSCPLVVVSEIDSKKGGDLHGRG